MLAPKNTVLPDYPGLAIESEQTVWQGRFPLQVIRFRHRRFDGQMSGLLTWELWRRGQAAAVLPYDPVADSVVLIEQFRLPALAAGVDPVMVEIPAGLADAGEDARTTALREAREETGMAPRRLHEVGRFLLTPGGADELVTLFVGEVIAPPAGIVGRAGLASENEDIQIRVWPADAAIAATIEGQFSNSVTTIALLWLAARRDWLRDRWKDAA